MDYINTFFQIKQQADGYPEGIVTDAKKDKYIENYYQVEGVTLVKEDIVKNLGMRSIGKLSLNSSWGKFGQRSNLTKTEYFTDPRELFETIYDPTKIVNSVNTYEDSMACVNYKFEEEFVEILSNTNVVIAAYITTQARLKLYSYLEKLKERVLYMDTD